MQARRCLIELDGIEAGLDDEAEKVTSICMEYGARNCRYARDEAERKKLWAARKGAFGAIGRITPDSMIQDAVVPRSRLPEVLGAAYDIAARYQLRIANVFHAGDGNLHPLICFDSRFPEEVMRVQEAGRELMEVCVQSRRHDHRRTWRWVGQARVVAAGVFRCRHECDVECSRCVRSARSL